MEFDNVLPSRAQNVIFHTFWKAPHREFSVIFVDFTFSLDFSGRFERFKEADGFLIRSFSRICIDPNNPQLKIHECPQKCRAFVQNNHPDAWGDH